jgi:GDP-4-dehydro-6-deoxy-D-mannose reductase
MRCVITGGRGFVGGHLALALRGAGHDVVLLDRAEVDVADGEAVRARFAATQPEAVFHLAALTHVGDSWADPDAVWRVNVGGTEAVLAAADAVGTEVVLIVGSAEEYGRVTPADVPLTESHPANGASPYGRSKVEATRRAVEFAASSPVRVVVARPFNHTGPGQTTRFLIPALAQRIREARASGTGKIAVGNLDPIRDIGDVRDVVRAYVALVEHGETGEIYNVSTGRGVSVREIAETLVAVAGVSLELRVDQDLVRPVDIPILIGDHTKLTAATGWEPEIALATTLADVLEFGVRSADGPTSH